MLKGIIKFTQAQYEEFMKNKTIIVNGITYNYDPDVLYTVEKINVTADTKQTISGDKDFTGKLTLNSNDVAVKKEVVTLVDSQTISGEKKFTGGIFKNDYEVASLNDIPPIVDALNSDSSTSSLSAKQGKILDEKISNAIATLNGKNNSFTFDTLDILLGHFDLEKGSEVEDSYLVNTDKINYNEQEYALKNGDVFFIVDTSVPDYWYSLDDKTLYKLETTRVDLAEYAKTSDLTYFAKKTDLTDYAKTSALSDYAKISALSDYAKTADVSKTYLKQTDIADWAKAANPPSNVVLIDDVDQNVDGLKVFLQGIETGNGILSTESGYKDARKCADDSNNINQLSLFIDSKGAVNLTHKNRTLNASTPDSYISFDATKLKYGTGKTSGATANNEYDIITSNYDAYKFALEEYQKDVNFLDIPERIINKTDAGVTTTYTPSTNTFSVKGKVTSDTNYILFDGLDIKLEPGDYTFAMVDYVNNNTDRLLVYLGKGGWGVEMTINNYGNNPHYSYYTFTESVTLDTLRFWTQNTLGELDYSFKLMITKGKKLPSTYYDYYGKLCRKGDNEQEFLKQEHDKSSNFYDISKITLGRSYNNTYEIGTDYIKQYSAGDYSYRIYSIKDLEIGETYTISFNALAVMSEGTYPRININEITSLYQDGIVDDASIGQALMGTSEKRFSFTFTSNTGYLNLALYNNYSTYNTSDYILVNSITLNKGAKDLGYQVHCGEIVHKNDLSNVALSGNYSDLIGKPSTVSTIDSSSNVPTSNAVKTFVEGKGYSTLDISSVKEDIVWDDFDGNWDGTSAITLSNFADYNAFDIYFYPSGPGGDGPSNYPLPICQRVLHPSSTGDFFVLFGIRNGNIYERQVTYSSYGKLTVSNPKLNGDEKSGNTAYVRMFLIAGVKTKMLQ